MCLRHCHRHAHKAPVYRHVDGSYLPPIRGRRAPIFTGTALVVCYNDTHFLKKNGAKNLKIKMLNK